MPAISTRNLDDGIVKGQLADRVITCDCCRQRAQGIVVREVTLPDGITPLISFVFYRQYCQDEDNHWHSDNGVKPVRYIGITCGCYAKGHRQIAHINHKRKKRGKK